ncbi:hypothetical protein PV325_002120 [Microctonus aethiopoides]|nr:hypothetical protein PV325_002120 [Microctonus aethiopoides]
MEWCKYTEMEKGGFRLVESCQSICEDCTRLCTSWLYLRSKEDRKRKREGKCLETILLSVRLNCDATTGRNISASGYPPTSIYEPMSDGVSERISEHGEAR